MAISSELLSSFAKIVAPKETRPEFTVVTGRAKSYAGKMYVQIDGSDQLTPIASSTVGIKDNDWVTVQIKNHSATVTGNATDPSAGTSYADDIKNQVDDVVDQISEFEIVIADKVSTTEFDAQVGRIDQLTSDNVNIKERLTATEADIGSLEADKADVTDLNAINATIENLDATKIDVDIADAKYATIANLEATNADIHNLEADYGSFKELTTDNFTAVNGDIDNLEATKLNVEDAKILYANIDFANIGSAAIENFFSKSGMIEDLVVGSGTITGHLVGVTISGDLIEGNTIKADKLVVLGEDGLYYKLNVGAETVSAQQTEYNSLNGSIITANTITAEKINVNDLVAFDATIGGFKIGSDSIYSGVKSSVDNTTSGVYMDDSGQFALGDMNNYLKYYRETGEDGTETWKLAISAQTITLGTSSKPLDQTIEEIQEDLENVGKPSVGGRNLISDSASFSGSKSASSDMIAVHPTLTAYGLTALQTAEQVTVSFRYSVPENSTGVIKLIPRTSPYQTEDDTETETVTEYDETLLNPIPEWPSLTGVTEGKFSYTTDLTQDHKLYFVDLGLFTNGVPTDGVVTISNVKVEIGSTETDWTPAPEDMATSDEIDGIQGEIGSINTQLGATVTIDALNQTISQLVVGEDGQSMMEQTENGFRFDFSSYQEQIQNALDTATVVEGEYSQVASDIDSLKESTSYLTELNSYITMGDSEGTPYIELGQQDGEFKVRITNTEMAFMQGTDKIAYITNNQLYIQSSVVTDEMKIGATDGFIWKRRGNGHMGLRWVNGDYES